MTDQSTGLNTPLQNEGNGMLSQLFSGMQKFCPHKVVMGGRVVFGVVITKIGLPRVPVDKELALVGLGFDPIEVHVDGFGSFLFDGVIHEALGSGVVNLQGVGVVDLQGVQGSCQPAGVGGLWMSHFLQGGPNGNGFLAIGECMYS